jgi:hypothetical protein
LILNIILTIFLLKNSWYFVTILDVDKIAWISQIDS